MPCLWTSPSHLSGLRNRRMMHCMDCWSDPAWKVLFLILLGRLVEEQAGLTRNSFGVVVHISVPPQFQFLHAPLYKTSDSIMHHYHCIKSYCVSGTELFECFSNHGIKICWLIFRSLWLSCFPYFYRGLDWTTLKSSSNSMQTLWLGYDVFPFTYIQVSFKRPDHILVGEVV